jgi:hypothetical protein
MPYDLFVDLTVKSGKLYIDSKEVKGGLTKDKTELIVDFKKGRADNPKVNAILLVKGNAQKSTHKDSYIRYQRFLVQL